MTSSVSRCPRHDSPLAKAIADFCTARFTPPTAATREAFPSHPVWRDLAATGTALWLDTGDVDAARALWTKDFVALTTNNTLLNKEVQKGIYDELMPEVAAIVKASDPDLPDAVLIQEIAFALNAVHGLMLVSTFDADVSVELHTNLAWDIDASYQYGKRFAAICPDRFIVKVPLTPEGILAAAKLHADGIRINFTLGFSARENLLIASAAQPTWVNVFMGRCNSFVADGGLGDGANVGEKATLASQRALRELRKTTGVDVKQIGASMRNGQQAFDLAGLDVFTMPTAAAEQYLERNSPTAEVIDRTDQDPEVTLTGGRTIEGEHLDALWSISDEVRSAAATLSKQDLGKWTGDQLRTLLADHGVGDLFAELSADERARIATDGKIPKYDAWADRVAAKTASWDGLLTESALAAFASDQTKLDDRIRQHL